MSQSDAVEIATALKLLKIESIEKSFRALKEHAAAQSFGFDPSKSKQKLRPYQVQAIANLDALLKQGAEQVGLQLPTGAGKTFVIHSYIESNFTRQKRTWWWWRPRGRSPINMQ